MRQRTFYPPKPPPPSSGAVSTEEYKPTPFHDTVPDGSYNDLWRCEGIVGYTYVENSDTGNLIATDTQLGCGKLWRIGSSCEYGHTSGPCPRGGYHPTSYKWRPATLWQRLVNRRGFGS